jgi:hypothetical protein
MILWEARQMIQAVINAQAYYTFPKNGKFTTTQKLLMCIKSFIHLVVVLIICQTPAAALHLAKVLVP